MAWRSKNGKWRRTVLFITAFLLIFFMEFLVYFIQAWSWQKLLCPSSSNCTRLLIVADPQILGELDEPNWITIWDSDHYLKRTFALAFAHSQPNAVVFLGDLMDEGSRADDFEFQRYVDRFYKVFPLDPVSKSLFLPGDNDIGGENGEPILPSVVNRFRHAFNKRTELVVNSCHIFKVNPVLEPIVQPDPWKVSSDTGIRIAVSHFPLLGMSTPFTHKILQDYKPHVIFSAHSHLSRLRRPAMSNPSQIPIGFGPVKLNYKNFTKNVHYDDGWPSVSDTNEIEVPTCSYRMGVAEMGYGYALFDETRQEFQYLVLWLPNRLMHLMFYTIFLVCCFLLFLWRFLCAYGRFPSPKNLR